MLSVTRPARAGLPYLQELLPKQSAAAEPMLKLDAHTAIMLQRSVYDALRDLKVSMPLFPIRACVHQAAVKLIPLAHVRK